MVYLDDIIVYGRDFDEALLNLRLVLERIRKAKLKLKTSKCALFRAQVPFLGHVVPGMEFMLTRQNAKQFQNGQFRDV